MLTLLPYCGSALLAWPGLGPSILSVDKKGSSGQGGLDSNAGLDEDERHVLRNRGLPQGRNARQPLSLGAL